MTVLHAQIKSALQENYTPVQLAAGGALQHRTTKPPRTHGNPRGISLLRELR